MTAIRGTYTARTNPKLFKQKIGFFAEVSIYDAVQGFPEGQVDLFENTDTQDTRNVNICLMFIY